MVKLTADLINGAAQYTNAVRERELDLSGRNFLVPISSRMQLTV